MNLTLEFRTKRSICTQIQEQLREKIQGKQLLPGDQLPAVRDLAAALKINFNTVARAYRDLDREGWISTQQGRGTYVLERPRIPLEDERKEIALVLDETLDRLFAEIVHRAIPESDLWEAIGRRKAAQSKRARKETLRLPRRITHKPGRRQALTFRQPSSNHPKRRAIKRSNS